MELRNEASTPTDEQLGKDATLNTEPANEVVSAEQEINATETTQTDDETLAQEVVAGADDQEQPATDYSSMSKEELVAALEALVQRPIDEIKREEGHIKQAFYTIRHAELEKEKAEFLAKGNEEAAFAARPDELELRVKQLLGELKDKRAAYNAALDEQRAANLDAKRAIILEIQKISADADNVNKQYTHVQDLRHQFQNIGDVPAAQSTEVWKAYQAAVEAFYDMLKMNKELRDYDFKKNLEQKQELCAEAEALANSDSVVDAFRTLQGLHDKWREIGPVAKDLRESLWARFKEASAAVNKRHQAYFEQRKQREKENEDAKTALCEKIEAIDTTQLATYAAWDEATAAIIALQEDWKKLGFAARKVNNALFARFRARCDEFFAQKAAFFRQMKEQMADNLARKIALCEKAEALRESTDWKATTDALVALQKEWKTIGPVVKKQSDVVWKRFVGACDYFFEQKNRLTVNVRQQERANLKAKRTIVTQINEQLASDDEAAAIAAIRQLMKQWQEIGHVPFKDKDKIYGDYKQAIDAAFERFDMKATRAAVANFKDTLAGSDSDKLYRERERLVRAYEQRTAELKTFSNNLGFFNAQSSSGNTMLREMQRRIAALKDDIALLEQKIRLIDEKLA